MQWTKDWCPTEAALAALSDEKLQELYDDVSRTIYRTILTLLAFSFFCIVTLQSPDASLLENATVGETAQVNVPLAGTVSFLGFLTVGPAVLLGLRGYLELNFIYRRRLQATLDAKRISPLPRIVHLQHPLLMALTVMVLYLLTPAVMWLYADKASALPQYSIFMLPLALVVIWEHIRIALRDALPAWRFSRRSVMGVLALVILAFCYLYIPSAEKHRRPFHLFGADLSAVNLTGAHYLTQAQLDQACGDYRTRLPDGLEIKNCHGNLPPALYDGVGNIIGYDCDAGTPKCPPSPEK